MATKKEEVAKEMRKYGLDPDSPAVEGVPEPKPGVNYTETVVNQGMTDKVIPIKVRTY